MNGWTKMYKTECLTFNFNPVII